MKTAPSPTFPGCRPWGAVLAGSLFMALAVFGLTLAAQGDEICGGCGKSVVVSGRFGHAPSDTFLIKNAQGEEASYREEIHGADFSLSVSDLPAGKYTVELGFAELQFNAPKQRLFDIFCGEQVLASNVDVYAAAGGKDTVWIFRAAVEHPGDPISGPLTFRFLGRHGDAKLNTFSLLNSNGVSLISTKAADLIPGDTTAGLLPPEVPGPVLWQNPELAMDVRVNDLIRRMSLAEKVSQLRNTAPAIPRLGLPAYDYWNECLHGVARAGTATVFPQAIGLAATWDAPLMHTVGDTIATEARAKHNDYVLAHHGDSAKYYGLTFWTPNINIFRDPRWGRGQETYGEDPFLTGRLAVSFIHGLQGDDPKYVKAMACAKHFAVHSGPESTRHTADVEPPERDFYETYLPQFEAAVREGGVRSVMGAYNSLFGTPACANKLLLVDLLRGQWGFDGYVVSDCGAIHDISAGHKFVPAAEAAAAAALAAGCDLCCGQDYSALVKAVRQGMISETQVNTALTHVLLTRFRLGLFEPAEKLAYARIPLSENDTPQHEALALTAARESMVLLKNNGLLPLDRAKVKRIAVIGANAKSVDMLLGNYNGHPSRPVTILDGIKSVAGSAITVDYNPGCPLAVRTGSPVEFNAAAYSDALQMAANADAVVYVGGLNPQLEGEEMPVNYIGFSGGDRTDIALPAIQTEFLKALCAAGKPVVYVNCSGSAVGMEWASQNVPAILQAWYPGEQGGLAVAETLFGHLNPAGRLPVTFYRSNADLPAFDNYSMSNRTYRYFGGKPLFAFGHGLGYTTFSYRGAKLNSRDLSANASVTATVKVKNSGKFDGDEVVEVYFRHLNSKVPQPQLALCGFARVHIPRGETVPVSIEIPAERLRYWDTTAKKYVVEPGDYELLIGSSSDKLPVKLSLAVR